MLEKLHDEMLTEAYVMSLFGLDPKEEKDVDHMAYLRNQKHIPHCSITHRVRVYPRQALSDWLIAQLKTEPIKRPRKPKAEVVVEKPKATRKKKVAPAETPPAGEEQKNAD